MAPPSGIDLKVERTRASVSQADIGRQMRLSRQAMWSLERAAIVDPERVRQYRDAIAVVVASRDGTAPAEATA